MKITHVRIDAGFPSGTVLAGLEAHGVQHVARLRANRALDRLTEPYIKRQTRHNKAHRSFQHGQADGARRAGTHLGLSARHVIQ